MHMLGAGHLAHDRAGELGFGAVVDRGRVVALELEHHAGAEGRRGVARDLVHAPLDQVEHLQREGAHRALDLAGIRHDVGGLAGMDHRHRDDGGVDRLLVAGDDGLEGLHHLAGHRHRVDAVVRQRGVRALAGDADQELVARGHDRAAADREVAGGQARPVVHAEDRVHGEAIEQAVLHHLARAAAAFLGGLEDAVDGAGEALAVRGQFLRGGQQHRHMAVVAAGMHAARNAAGVREGVVLGHRQRIHVGAQADGAVRASGCAAADRADHAGAPEPAVHLDAPALERSRDDVGGAHLLEAEFRMGVDVASDRDDGGEIGGVHGGRDGGRDDGFGSGHLSVCVFWNHPVP